MMWKILLKAAVSAIMRKDYDTIDLWLAGLGATAVFIWLSGTGPFYYFLIYLALMVVKGYLNYRINAAGIDKKYGVK